jgi:hypothetical protein
MKADEFGIAVPEANGRGESNDQQLEIVLPTHSEFSDIRSYCP